MTITVGYRISNDFGATWGPATLVALPPDDNVQANATVAADEQGNLYLAWAAELVSAGARSNQHVFLATAGQDSLQFGAPTEVTDPAAAVGAYDRPHVAVTSKGTLNVSYTQISSDLKSFLVINASSTDSGKSWVRTTLAGPGSSGSYRNQARVCHAKGGGRIFLSWVDQDVGGIALIHSDDEGATWSSASPLLVSLRSELSKLAYAPTDCVTDGHSAWALYALSDVAPTSAVTPVFTHLRLAHSGDGVTVDSPVDVADTNAAPVTMNPAIVAEDDGSLDLAYYAGQAANDATAAFRRSRSTDAGQTFTPSVDIHDPLTLETSRAAPQWIGDYVNSAYASGQLYLVYTDNASSTPHISFYRSNVR
jgi:hypothetical protein